MDLYKIQSLILIQIIYLILLIPAFCIFSKNINSKKDFLKNLCLSTIIEIILFSAIYIFPRNILRLFPIPKNIENYSFYALKILFIASIFTPIHYALPIYLVKTQKKKKAVMLFSLKFIYIPVFVFIISLFPIKFALFSIPILDLIYSSILFVYLIKYC